MLEWKAEPLALISLFRFLPFLFSLSHQMADDQPAAVKPEDGAGGSAPGGAGGGGDDPNFITIKVQTPVRAKEKKEKSGNGASARARTRPARTPSPHGVPRESSPGHSWSNRASWRGVRGMCEGRRVFFFGGGGEESARAQPAVPHSFTLFSSLSSTSQDGAVIQFKTKRTTALKKLMKAFAERQGGARERERDRGEERGRSCSSRAVLSSPLSHPPPTPPTLLSFTVDIASFRFTFDGDRVEDTHTPEDVSFERERESRVNQTCRPPSLFSLIPSLSLSTSKQLGMEDNDTIDVFTHAIGGVGE